MAFFGLQTFKLKDFSKIYQFKGLKPFEAQKKAIQRSFELL